MKSSVVFFLSLCCCVVPWCDTRITSSPFGWTKVNTKPHQCRLYTLKNRSNVSVNILDYGATIVGISLPDKNNKFADIVMGFEDVSAYVENPFNSHFGATVGRVVNRIGGASFSIAGHRYNRVWEGHVEGERLTLSYLSADGEEGYPGQVLAHVTYWLSEMNELHVQMLATATKPTPINLANHAYFNLAGHVN
ncbi:hypothetical protein B566_EDAN008962 [Ephemera danica]|nr:hypothetical protein B566_EDAN008962 [Ephemera danica]